jgi:nucleoside diphosphate kinase
MSVEKALAEKHYADLSSKPFFPALVDYICSGPVVAMVRAVRCVRCVLCACMRVCV